MYESYALSVLEENKKRAVKNFEFAIDMREKLTSSRKKYRSYIGIPLDRAYICCCKNDLSNAEIELLKIIDYISENNYKPILDYLKVYQLLCRIYMESQKYDLAIEASEKCIDLCNALDESDYGDRINMGVCFYELGNCEQSYKIAVELEQELLQLSADCRGRYLADVWCLIGLIKAKDSNITDGRDPFVLFAEAYVEYPTKIGNAANKLGADTCSLMMKNIRNNG